MKYSNDGFGFNLKNNGQIKFCQSLDSCDLYNEDKIFDRLFFNGEEKISEKEMVEINDGLYLVAIGFLDSCGFKTSFDNLL
jgi:hypothetical protein